MSIDMRREEKSVHLATIDALFIQLNDCDINCEVIAKSCQ